MVGDTGPWWQGLSKGIGLGYILWVPQALTPLSAKSGPVGPALGSGALMISLFCLACHYTQHMSHSHRHANTEVTATGGAPAPHGGERHAVRQFTSNLPSVDLWANQAPACTIEYCTNMLIHMWVYSDRLLVVVGRLPWI